VLQELQHRCHTTEQAVTCCSLRGGQLSLWLSGLTAVPVQEAESMVLLAWLLLEQLLRLLLL
jgi:hypothetical protein